MRQAVFQGQLDSAQHSLLIVLQNQRQNLHHLPVATWPLQQIALQALERLGQVGERRAVTQSPGLRWTTAR